MVANNMLDRLNKLKELHKKDRETFDYKLETVVLEITNNMLKRMEEIKINRTELAERLGVTKAAVTGMLDGNTNFTLKRLLAVATALDCEKVSVTFPPRGFTAPAVFVSQAGRRMSNRDYRSSDSFKHLENFKIDDEQVA